MPSSVPPWASVIIPIKDERNNLVPLLTRLVNVLEARQESRTASFEIIFVDDGSTDGSSDLLDRLAQHTSAVTVLHFDRNYGKTSALHAGFKQARGEIVIIMDGDLQNDPSDIETLLPYLERYDMACGWRTTRQDHFIRKLSSRIGNAIRNAVIADGMHDTACGFMMFRRAVAEHFQLFEGMHRFLPALALMNGFTVREVPIRHYPRLHGVPKYGVGNRLFKGLYDLIAVRWMQSRCLRYRLRPPLQSPDDHLAPSRVDSASTRR